MTPRCAREILQESKRKSLRRADSRWGREYPKDKQRYSDGEKPSMCHYLVSVGSTVLPREFAGREGPPQSTAAKSDKKNGSFGLHRRSLPHEHDLQTRALLESQKDTQFPLKGAEFGEPGEFPFLGSDHANTHPPSARCNQRVVGEPCPAALFVTILGCNASEHSSRLCPVIEIRNQYPLRPAKIVFQALDLLACGSRRAGIKFLKDYCAQPKRPIGKPP